MLRRRTHPLRSLSLCSTSSHQWFLVRSTSSQQGLRALVLLSVEQVLKFGAQIADALDKAHRCCAPRPKAGKRHPLPETRVVRGSPTAHQNARPKNKSSGIN
jgi:hypothetical protein